MPFENCDFKQFEMPSNLPYDLKQKKTKIAGEKKRDKSQRHTSRPKGKKTRKTSREKNYDNSTARENDRFLGFFGTNMTVGGTLDHNKIENEPYVFENGVVEPEGVRGERKEKAITPRYKL